MKLYVTEIECYKEHTYIIGTTSIGQLKGIWKHREKPIIHQEYSFELDIASVDRSMISTIDRNGMCSESVLDKNVMSFRGICEEIDEVYVIRFLPEWIELIEIENDDFSIKKGDCVSFTVNCDNIRIYPY